MTVTVTPLAQATLNALGRVVHPGLSDQQLADQLLHAFVSVVEMAKESQENASIIECSNRYGDEIKRISNGQLLPVLLPILEARARLLASVE